MKYLLLFVIILKMSFAANSQTSKDTICFTLIDAKKVLIAAKQKLILDSQVVVLNSRISGYEFAIAQYQVKDSARVEGHKKEVETLNKEKELLVGNIAALNKALRREKTKRVITGAAGILTTVGVLFLTR